MGKLQSDHQGFSIVEVALLLVIAALIGGAGFLVYKNHNKTTTNSVVATTAKKPAATTKSTTQTPDPYVGWKTYANLDGHFALNYPATWVSSICADHIFLLGQSSDALRNCNTEADGQSQMSIQWWTNTDNPSTSPDELCMGQGPVTSKGSATVSGISAVKIESTYATQVNVDGEPGMADGTRTIQYCFAGKHANYRVTYMQRHTNSSTIPDDQSVVDDFNSMVTKTFTAQ